MLFIGTVHLPAEPPSATLSSHAQHFTTQSSSSAQVTMAKEPKGDTARRAAVGEDLARLIPDDGIPWYKKRHLLLLNFYAISLGLLSAANGYDGSMIAP